MKHEIKEYNELGNLFEKLNIQTDSLICFLPENLYETEDSKEFIYSESTTDLNKILKKENKKINYLTNDKPLLRSRKSADWFGPTILFGITVISQNSQLVDITISLLSSYLYDFFKGTGGTKKVKFDIVIGSKNKKSYKRISYEGSVEGVKELNEVIKKLKK